MTFLEVALKVLESTETPMTANEIWSHAEKSGLAKKLDSKGKTPWASMRAMLFVEVRDNPNSKVKGIA